MHLAPLIYGQEWVDSSQFCPLPPNITNLVGEYSASPWCEIELGLAGEVRFERWLNGLINQLLKLLQICSGRLG